MFSNQIIGETSNVYPEDEEEDEEDDEGEEKRILRQKKNSRTHRDDYIKVESLICLAH